MMAQRQLFGFGFLLFLGVEGLLKRKFLLEPEEITKDTFESKLKEKKCLFLYATRKNCDKCQLLYNKFLTLSQTFVNEPDISFGYFTDRALADAFDIGSLPAIVYYEFGSASPTLYRGDITVGALTNVATKAMKEDLRYLTVRYAVQLTRKNFDDIMETDKQYRLVMLHEEDDEDEIEAFDELAKTYDNDMEIVLARINVDRDISLDSKYISTNYPSFYWYAKGTVDKKKRYGGDLIIEQMIAFLNRETGFHRLKGGKLRSFAGLVKPLDDVINKHGKNLNEIQNIGDIIKDVKKTIAKLPEKVDEEITDYYIHLLNELEEDRTQVTLTESRRRLYRQMEGAGPLKIDQIYRKLNIIHKFLDIISTHMLKELTNGDIGLPKDSGKSYQTATEGVEFHEEF